MCVGGDGEVKVEMMVNGWKKIGYMSGGLHGFKVCFPTARNGAISKKNNWWVKAKNGPQLGKGFFVFLGSREEKWVVACEKGRLVMARLKWFSHGDLAWKNQ